MRKPSGWVDFSNSCQTDHGGGMMEEGFFFGYLPACIAKIEALGLTAILLTDEIDVWIRRSELFAT